MLAIFVFMLYSVLNRFTIMFLKIAENMYRCLILFSFLIYTMRSTCLKEFSV
jgi:hypothetical protein